MDRTATILVVDDDPDFLDSTRMMLEREGYHVTVAPGIDEAVTEMMAARPDLIILDVMMDEWDSGFKLMWDLKTDDGFADIPILMVTAVDDEMCTDFASHANAANRTAADEEYLPVDGYIVKPVETAGLLKAVERVLRRAGAEMSSR